MQHPLENVPDKYRKRFFFTFLLLILILFGIFRVLDQPLQTPAAPAGIVSLELAGTQEKAYQILESWTPVKGFDLLNSRIRHISAAFGLGLDYLFMPLYSFALAFGTLLAAGKQGGWFKSLGAVASYGAFVAAGFDALENYALFQILLGKVFSPYPEIAFYCASIKFGLLIFGSLYGLTGLLSPKK